MSEAITGPRRKRCSKNLHLAPNVVSMAEEIQKADHRSSLSNTLEHLVIEEGKRRGMALATSEHLEEQPA